MSQELPAHRLKRLHMRSMRRGIKEMDLILSDFARHELAEMTGEELDHYDRLLSQNDQDLISWVTGASEIPEEFADLIATISRRARGLINS